MKNKLQQALNAIALLFSSLKKLIFKATAISGTVGGKFKKPTNNPDLIDINTIDIGNLKTIDDVLDYVNQVVKDRFTNGSISDLIVLVENKSFEYKTYEWFVNEYPDDKVRLFELGDYIHYMLDGKIPMNKELLIRLFNIHNENMVEIYGFNPIHTHIGYSGLNLNN